MSQSESQRTSSPVAKTVFTEAELDAALTAQLIVAWAGESGEERRLGWWRTDMVSEFGGEDLFGRLLPNTSRWAVLQTAREAARRCDAGLRKQDHNPDRIVSLFSLGFELDERLEERLLALKQSGQTPEQALPALTLTREIWRPELFWSWVRTQGEAETTAAPVGRRLKSAPATSTERVRLLVAALAPASAAYPLPHFRRSP